MKNKMHALASVLTLCTLTLLFHTSAWGKEHKDTPLFAENKGQLKDQEGNKRKDILYYGNSDGISYYLKNGGISYQLYKQAEGNQIAISRIDVEWLGANPLARIDAGTKSPFIENFYKGDIQGITGVGHFGDIHYKNLYPGIDLHYYYKEGALKYDFEVAGGTDYKQIRIRLAGATGLSLEKDGTITIRTPNGIIKEGTPITYQNGHEVQSAWVLKGNELAFELSGYDPSLPLVIDPLIVRLGGGASLDGITNYLSDIVFDSNGSFYIPYKRVPNSSSSVSYIKKVNVNMLVWENTVQSSNGTVDALHVLGTSMLNNNLYVCGTGGNPVGIATTGAYQTTVSGGYDCVIAKFDANGNKVWGTFYGGTGQDSATSCQIDASGNTYLCGSTRSAVVMASATAYQPGIAGGSDAFVAKFDANGMRVWGTYYGGSNDDAGMGLALKGNRIFVAGSTKSTNGIAMSGFQSSLSGTQNAFLLCMDTSGVPQWSTYYGADNTQGVYCLTTNNAVYLTGNTNATTNIATAGSYQPAQAGGTDAFLAKFTMSGSRQWGTYFGGSGTDMGMDAAIGNNDNIYICGSTTSSSGMTTPMAYNEVYAPGTLPSTAYLVEFDTLGQRLYGTYYNLGVAAEYCAVSAQGDVMIVSRVATGGISYLDFRFCNDAKPLLTASASHICSNQPVTLSIPAVTGAIYNWYKDNGDIAGAATNTYIAAQAGTYRVVVNHCPSGRSDSVVLDVVPAPVLQIDHADIPCYGGQGGIIAVTTTAGTPPFHYAWDGRTDTTAYLSGLDTGNYIVHTTDSNGCVATANVTINLDTVMQPSDPLVAICAVTVDSVTGHNLVVWEKLGNVKAVSYNIYRETSVSGQYGLIGTVPVSDPGTFLDNTAIPLQQSYSYKIAETDSCDHEWPLSALHKTIRLSANVGPNGELNLNWNAYEGKAYFTHNIERSNNGGNYVLLDQVSATTLSYSDLTPPAGSNKYRVSIDLATPCVAATSSTFQKIASNVVVLNPTGINDAALSAGVLITPNPTNGIINVFGTKPYRLGLYDVSGKMLLDRKAITQLDISHFSKGIYLVALFDKNGNMYYKQKVILK